MSARQLYFFSLSLLVFTVNFCHCWDTRELELFDLVEEINANFYDVLGVEQTASSAEIRKAYRKLSVKLHPDKNKEEGAEEKFRRIVAIYEVLKDEQQRIRYNDVLANGLPDWRTPVYYYRKARKLGLLELAILMFVIITIGQFIVGWSMYLEKKFEMEEVFTSRKKKEKKGKKGKQAEQDFDEALKEHLNTLPRPKLTDLLPCKLVLGTVFFFTSIPTRVQQFKEWRELRKQVQEESSEEEIDTDETEEKVKRPKRRQRVDIPEFDQLVPESNPVVYMAEIKDQAEEKRDIRTGKEWTDDEISFLAKAVAKFPSGTSNRWEKIAEMVGRSVSEVTSKSKSIKQNVIMSVNPASQGVTGSVTEKLALKKGLAITQDITRATVDNKSAVKLADKAAKTVNKPAEKPPEKRASKNTDSSNKLSQNNIDSVPAAPVSSPVPDKLSIATGGAASGAAGGPEELDRSLWTQTQQKTLEWALGNYPKGTPERWEKVAEHITGKTKEDCIARFKYLAETIKRKKAEAIIANDTKR